MSKLSNAMQAGKAKPAEVSKFAQAIAGARVRHPFVIPRLNLPAVMTLCPSNRFEQIEGAVHARMRELKLELNSTTEIVYEGNRAARVLAAVCFDPEALERNEWVPIGTYEDWAALDGDIVGDCWRTYGDVRHIYDPVSESLDPDELFAIAEAVKKNNPMLLRYFGVRRLATYLLTMVVPPQASASPTSGDSESSAAIST